MDYYKILGVARNASESDIKTAYRRLASQHHPDKGGDTTRFQEIQTAYETLSDPNKRQNYDNPQQHFSFNFGGSPFGESQNIHDIFNTFFGRGFGNPTPQPTRASIWISLRDVYEGGKRVIGLGSQHIEINIPESINDGDQIRYPKLGPGQTDLIIQFRIKPDPIWSRQESDLCRELDCSVWDLILGNSIDVKLIDDRTMTVTINPNTQIDSVLRIRGQGLLNRNSTRGDVLIRLKPKLPNRIHPDILNAIARHKN